MYKSPTKPKKTKKKLSSKGMSYPKGALDYARSKC